jgi:hypothetical protein
VLVAANLTSEAESDVRARKLARGKAVVKTTAASQLESFTSWDWLLAAVALLVLLADAWWLTRRVRPRAPLPAASPELPDRAVARGRAA